jgi:hypothetical protein
MHFFADAEVQFTFPKFKRFKEKTLAQDTKTPITNSWH